jgi:hypothetical protein
MKMVIFNIHTCNDLGEQAREEPTSCHCLTNQTFLQNLILKKNKKSLLRIYIYVCRVKESVAVVKKM